MSKIKFNKIFLIPLLTLLIIIGLGSYIINIFNQENIKTVEQSKIQDLQKIEQYKTSKLKNGNLVVKIPYKILEQEQYFKSWQNLDDTMMRNEIKSDFRLFIFDINNNKPVKYLGNDVVYMADFDYLDNNYWVIYENSDLYITKDMLQNKIKTNSKGLKNITDFVKDDQKEGIFYITTVDEKEGSKINTVDFKITIINKDDNIITKFY